MKYNLVIMNDELIQQLSPLAKNAKEDGYNFVQRTIDEWNSGINKFDLKNEVLYGVKINNDIVAIGGCNQDPYVMNERIGRIRHVYVHKDFRGLGLSTMLMDKVLDFAKERYPIIRLSTNNPVAAMIYENYGFTREFDKKQTHILHNEDTQ